MRTYSDSAIGLHILQSRHCDGCGIDLPLLAGCNHYFDELTLRFSHVKSCPEGDDGYQWQVEDLCESCASKLLAAIQALDFSIKHTEIQ